MRKKRNEHKFRSFLGKFLPYVAAFLLVFGIAKVGSESKNESAAGSINMNAMAAENYNVSADQLSELYVVASLSNSFNLASVDTVAGNYVVVQSMREISQTTVDRIEKPSVVDTGLSRGVIMRDVKEGESMASIAAKYGLTTDQIRWSNGLKTTNVEVGQVLKLPNVPGIVYTVKAGDSIDSLASRYRSAADRIIATNDLEVSALVVGSQIVLPGGSLPFMERPEYVAPTAAAYYSYSGSYASRENLVVVARGAWNGIYNNPAGVNGNPMVRGQCTWYAWYWRNTEGVAMGFRAMPGGGTLGHAKFWAARAAAQGFTVNRTPEVGAVFQTSMGYYGHVGIVLAVNGDGSIFVREMNFDGRGTGTLTESTIPASAVGTFNYIH